MWSRYYSPCYLGSVLDEATAAANGERPSRRHVSTAVASPHSHYSPCSSSPPPVAFASPDAARPPLLRLRPRWPPRHWPPARCGLRTAATLPPLRRVRVRARQPPPLQGRAAARWLRTSAPPTPRSRSARTAGFPGTDGNAPTNQTDHSDFRLRLLIASQLSTRAVERPEADVVVIGSGLGGLCCAGLLARYGQDVLVLESHDRPGGAAHSFDIKGFNFDSGPSLFSGFQSRGPQANPLAQVISSDTSLRVLLLSFFSWIHADGHCY